MVLVLCKFFYQFVKKKLAINILVFISYNYVIKILIMTLLILRAVCLLSNPQDYVTKSTFQFTTEP